MAKRVRTLLVPYLLWNLFAWALQLAMVALQGHADWIPASAFYPQNFVDNFIGMGDGFQGMPKAFQLWFLRDLMLMCLLAPPLYLLLRSRKAAFVALLLMGVVYVVPWSIGWPSVLKRFPSALLFFSAGAYMGIHKQNMVQAARKVPLWASLLAATLLMGWHVWLLMRGSGAAVYAENLFSIAATLPTLQMASLLVERREVKPHPWVAGSAFLLFATHPLIMHYLLVEPLMDKLEPSRIHFWAILAAEVAVPVVVCAAVHGIATRVAPRASALLTGGRA